MTAHSRPYGPTSAPGRSYEVRVRTHVAPAQAAALARLVHGTTVPRHTVRRLALVRDADHPVDLPTVVRRLTECDVAVLDVRLSRLPGEEGPA